MTNRCSINCAHLPQMYCYDCVQQCERIVNYVHVLKCAWQNVVRVLINFIKNLKPEFPNYSKHCKLNSCYSFVGAFHTFRKIEEFVWKQLVISLWRITITMWSHYKKFGLNTIFKWFEKLRKNFYHSHIISTGNDFLIICFDFVFIQQIKFPFSIMIVWCSWSDSYWITCIYSGVFGSGLCVLSKYPIVSTLFHAWSVNGYVHRVHHGNDYLIYYHQTIL